MKNKTKKDAADAARSEGYRAGWHDERLGVREIVASKYHSGWRCFREYEKGYSSGVRAFAIMKILSGAKR